MEYMHAYTSRACAHHITCVGGDVLCGCVCMSNDIDTNKITHQPCQYYASAGPHQRFHMRACVCAGDSAETFACSRVNLAHTHTYAHHTLKFPICHATHPCTSCACVCARPKHLSTFAAVRATRPEFMFGACVCVHTNTNIQ